MAKVITFFNHKGGVGKTTLVHNLAFALADKKQRVLVIDADQQMNLTAAMYGLSNSIDYATDDDSKWQQYTAKHISLIEHLNVSLKNESTEKVLFRKEGNDNTGYVDLISGSINLTVMEADLYGIIRNKNNLTRDIPHKFEQAIRNHKSNYDFILIDTSPSASSIINGLIVMSSDYFIAPVSPSFFSLQAIDNLSAIFQSWLELLGDYVTTAGFRGLNLRVKFLGLVVQLAKRYKGGGSNSKMFTTQSEDWITEVNKSVAKFHSYALSKGHTISKEEFEKVFINKYPFIIEKCCDFTPQLRSIAEKEGVPVIYLTQEICRKHNPQVDITKPEGQYKKSFESIQNSYNSIADGLINLKLLD